MNASNLFFFFQAEDGILVGTVTGVQTCALPISIVGGDNYGQGSSREHAAAVLMHLGVRLVIAKSFARMHRDNLVNFGLPPLVFANSGDYDGVQQGDRLRVTGLIEGLRTARPLEALNVSRGHGIRLTYDLSSRQREILLEGGGIRYLQRRRGGTS